MVLVFVTLCSNICFAQQQHFVYIQSDDRQPFYVKLDSKVISSTSSGYAIIPKISKSDLEMQIGFPKNEFPPQKLLVTVNGDAGYNLKNFGAGKWGLFNLQTMEIVYAGDKKEDKILAASSPKSATEMKNDSKEVEAKEVSVANTVSIPKDNRMPDIKELQKKNEEIPTSQSVNAVERISKTKEDNGEKEYVAVYKIQGVNTTEYIDVSIAKTINSEEKESGSAIKKTEAPQPPPVKEVGLRTEEGERFLDIELANPNTKINADSKVDSTQSPTVKEADKKELQKLSFNSDCKAQATDNDFFDLRKSMATKRTDEEMREVAIKYFKKKCFTTAQIKGLASILLVEENRLLFYGSAYPYSSDPQNYGSLKAELSTIELKERFENLINRK